MDSPPPDEVLLKGVAAIVHALAEFAPVHEMFQTHLTRWRKRNCLIAVQRRKLETQLAKFWRKEPKAADPDEYKHWPARRIYSPDRTKSKLVPIPQKFNDKLQKYDDPSRYHLLRSLYNKQDFSPTESFILLAELHDAAYPTDQLGYAVDYIVDVAEATNLLDEGLSQIAVQNLATLVERVLDLIEARADSKSRNKTGKTLQQIIHRSREKRADLVIRSRPHFVTHTDRESGLDAAGKSQSDVKASLMIPEPAANVAVIEQREDRSGVEPVKPAAAGSLLDSIVREFAKATERVPDGYKEQGRECGPLEWGKTALAKAITRNPKAKPDDLKKHHGGKVFVREISKRKLEVFFRSFREFNAAKEFSTSANSE